MRLTISLLMAFAFIACAGCATPGNALFSLGQRQLDKGLWEPIDNQFLFGVTVAMELKSEPMEIEFGLLPSLDSASDFDPASGATLDQEALVSEYFVGVRKTFNVEKAPLFHPYISGGLSFVMVDVEVTVTVPGFGTFSASDDDSSVGAYVGGGAFFRLGQKFLLGANLRYTLGTDISFGGGPDGDVDGLQFGLLLGWGWPGSQR